MRIVILGSSVYSETACAMAVRLSELGYIPSGVLSLSALHPGTLLRKIGQWGFRDVTAYARTKLPFAAPGGKLPQLRNPYLRSWLLSKQGMVSSVRDVAKYYGFPFAVCNDQHSPDSVSRLREWSPDLIVFTGGSILRKPVLELPRLGILNVHLGLLPEIRGMSSPEWSLLTAVPVGITIHFIDAGIDTGPVLERYELPDPAQCASLTDLRNRLVALGIEKMGDVVAALDRGSMIATRQSQLEKDNQFFVMHEWLQARASERLSSRRAPAASEMIHG